MESESVMIGKELPKTNITNNDLKDVVFGRRATRAMDPNFKLSREEIIEIFSEANACTPSAVNTQPYKFLVLDTDEGKKKLDQIMRPPFDRDRTTSCAFAVVIFADRKWIEGFDELYQNELTTVPDYPEVMVPATYDWYEELTAGDGSYLDKSINFQAGQFSMMLQVICRAHGLETSVMDAWDPELLVEAFGIDLERYVPEVVLTIGKGVGEAVTERYRYTGDHFIIWG